MSADRLEIIEMAACLARRLSEHPEPREIADGVVAIFEEIEAALSPIIGVLGVDALYRRSLQLARAEHPWLLAAKDGSPLTLQLVVLRTALSQQPSAAATVAGSKILQTFHDLLATLVGGPLTERLLHSLTVHASGRQPSQESTP